MLKSKPLAALSAIITVFLSASIAVQAETITIATVNNGDMIRMQGLTDDFTAKTGHSVDWVTLEENVLRQRVTTDISTKGGAFDIMTIGMYETPIWAKNSWLVPLDDLSAEYDIDDILPAMRGGLSLDGTLYAAPFYGESSMIMYRKDLVAATGMSMSDAPTWDEVAKLARAMTDKENQIYGVCLRGKPVGARTWRSSHQWGIRSVRDGSTRTGRRSSTATPGPGLSISTWI